MRRFIVLFFGAFLLSPARWRRRRALSLMTRSMWGKSLRLAPGCWKTASSSRSIRCGARSAPGLPPQAHSRAREKLAAPDLCDRLRQSTLAVGSYYKCPDCGEWHFNGSAGFVVGEGGIICTCCHVVTAEDEGVKESYLIAADDAGRVFPVQSVLAADTESDSCLVKIDAPGLKPLPLRTGVRAGERVYCLSHPGGYFFMFTQGMVARVNLKRNEVLDEHGHTNGMLTRPILFLNVTAEFAPGSSGAPVVDEAGNVVAQVASIAEAGEPSREHQRSPVTQRARSLLHRLRGNPAPDPAEQSGRP